MAPITMMPVNIATYLEQWLKTATGGKVSAVFAVAADRVRFLCHTCQATYSVATPKDTTIDFGIQQFVELHSHKGGYTKPTGDRAWGKDMHLVTPVKNDGGEILKIATGRKFR
jgi:hypothetical protein